MAEWEFALDLDRALARVAPMLYRDYVLVSVDLGRWAR